MPQNADGHWPPNVSAVIITPEEKRARLAQSPPGGQIMSNVGAQVQGVPGAPHATIETKYVIPNVNVPNANASDINNTNINTHNNNPNNRVKNMPTPTSDLSQQSDETQFVSDDFCGTQAIKLAKKMGVDIVWKTADKSPVDLATAEQLINSAGQNSVYFDFELLEQLPDDDEEEDIEAAIMAEMPPEINTAIATTLTQIPSQNVVPQPAFQPPTVEQDSVSDREKLAWGGVLSTPGQTVYFRPNVIRVEVEGNVKVQKGLKGNVRMMRITRTTPQGTVQLANAVHTQVQPPLAQSPNPATVYRQANPAFPITDKVPVPKPQVPIEGVNKTDEKPDHFDEFDF